MVPTKRLYWELPLLEAATATVLAARPGRLVLDATILYPEGGGQLADRGTVSWRTDDGETVTSRIEDVQVSEEGVIEHHLIAPQIPALGSAVTLTLDGRRRRDHRAQHSAQHLLSQAFFRRHGQTVSTRLGADRCTIDLLAADGHPLLSEAAICGAEEEVNALVLDDVPVVTRFVVPAELAALGLRKAPTVSENIRIVSVADYDHTPCGGTHVLSTAQVGYVHIAMVERYKGGLRVSFHAGPRIPPLARASNELLSELARPFSTAPDALPARMEKLRQAAKDAEAAKGAAYLAYAELVAFGLPAGDRGAARELRVPSADIALLRAVAAAAANRCGLAIVEGIAGDRGVPLVVHRSGNGNENANTELRERLLRRGGKGGGTAERAEGWIPVVPG